MCSWTLAHLAIEHLVTLVYGQIWVDLGGEGEGKVGGWAVSRRELTGPDFLQQAGKWATSGQIGK